MVWLLRADFHLRLREVWIGVNWHALERNDAADRDGSSQDQHQEPLTKRRSDYRMDHAVELKLVPKTPELSVRLKCYCCNEFANCRNRLPSPMTLSPAFKPLVI